LRRLDEERLDRPEDRRDEPRPRDELPRLRLDEDLLDRLDRERLRDELDRERPRDDDLRERPPLEREPRLGTFPPSRRASDSPIAIACLRLVTFLPERPDRSVPCLRSCMAFSTLFEAFLPYLRPPELLRAKGHLLSR
jgi:hypothetical protein